MTVDLSIFKTDNSIFTDSRENQLMDQVAKLMAKENITIVYGNFRTAAFDVLNRVMFFPTWKQMAKPLKFRLRMHEMGHAIYTRIDKFHEEMYKKFGKTLAHYINVVEDDRIDRFTLRDFPGSRNYVIEGSRDLFDRGFFGTKNLEECKTMIFIDRLNINSKMGSDVFPMPIQNSTEAELYTRFKTTNTFDEVIQLSKDILEYAMTNETKMPSVQNGGMLSVKSPDNDEDAVIDFPSMGGGDDEEFEGEKSNEESSGYSVKSNSKKDSDSDSDNTDGEGSDSEGKDNSESSSGSENNSESGNDSDKPSESDGEASKPSNGSGAGNNTNTGEKIDSVESKTDEAYREKESQIDTENFDPTEKTPNYSKLAVQKPKLGVMPVKSSDFISRMKSYKI